MNFFKNKRKRLLLAIDFLMVVSIYLFVLGLIYMAGQQEFNIVGYLINFGITAFSIFALRFIFLVYSNMWRYADAAAYLDIVVSDTIGGLVALAVTRVIDTAYLGVWQTASVVAMICVLTLASRFIYQQRVMNKKTAKREKRLADSRVSVAIIGAGSVGSLLADELLYNSKSTYVPLCFVDRDDQKIGAKVKGLPVFKNDRSVVEKLRNLRISNVIVALPKITAEDSESIINFYTREGFGVKVYELPITEGDSASRRGVLREIKIEDLLFRDALDVVSRESLEYYRDKVVLVTGGGGSIGSELCRQIADMSPKQLIIFDIYENNAYDIQQCLIAKHKDKLNLAIEIGSVRDRVRLEAVFAYYKPQVVFHAAAHKHVPLMEHSNCEAIKNNVLGTYNTADMAEKYGVEKFILISTDKAVNPTNVMGASKRMCEMVVQCRKDSKTKFAAVRFGNVLGSNGSVIPLFKRQIAQGGPVTVTDKRIIRYFMTIPEAAGLVMQAGSMAGAGDLFVLDMGKPVKILELAENMVRLSGMEPYRDIDIVETGLRPGEKLYEELLVKTDDLRRTDNNMIFIEHEDHLSRDAVEEKLEILRRAVAEAEGEISPISITDAMKRVVPTFRDPESVNSEAESAKEMKLAEK